MTKRIVVAVFFLSFLGAITAQNADFKNTLSVNVGLNAFNSFAGTLNASKDTAGAQYDLGRFTAGPTFQVAWDYGIAKWFSVGIAGSYNGAKYTYDNVQYKGKKLGEVQLTAGRTTFSVRPLFHYGNSGDWDFYSGFRLGVGLWSGRISLQSNDELQQELLSQIDEDLQGFVPSFIRKRLVDNVGARAGFAAPTLQIIPFGARYYFTENIGVNAELAFGSPYYLSAGVNARF
jgi:opacity protein-like surface antigen